MRKALPVGIALLFAIVNAKAQSSTVAAATDLGFWQPEPAIPGSPAQIGIGANPMAQGAGLSPFGNGEQPVLRFAGDNGPQNLFTFSLSDDTGYDDNLFGSDQARARDFFTSVGPRVTFVTARQRLTFDFDYAPFFEMYKQYSGRDSVDQSLALDAAAELSPRFQLRVREYGSEFYYGLLGGNGEQVVGGLGPPGVASPYFINPNTRNIMSTSRVDLVFNKSARTSINVFGGFTTLNYKNLGTTGTYPSLEAPSGGLSYSYALTARGKFSATYSYMKSVYTGSLNPPRFQTQSVSLSYAYQISNALSVSFFGGPQYTRTRETLVIPFPPFGFLLIPEDRLEWNWSGGASVQRVTPVSTISLSASKYVSSGGALAAAIDFTSGELAISRRLTLGWTGTAGLHYMQARSLSFGGLPGGSYNIQYGNLGFQHKLTERATVRLNYAGTRQRHGLGTTLAYADLDRNRASVGIDWQIGKAHLGH